MKKSSIILVVLLVVLVVMFAGCGASANGVSGLWYEVTGLGGTLEFKSGDVVTASAMGLTLDGTYTFDAASGKGTVTVMETESPFELKDGKIILEGSTYGREKVEQQDLGDLLEGLGDALASPGN
jgi:hypothetical protein